MIVQEFLRADGTLAQLTERYAIKARRHGRYPNLVLLKYDQINSPFAEPIVQECRGVILDEAERWNVVARGFDKFFNHGEGRAAPIDWSTAKVQAKEDGSLCVLYHYNSDWHVATSGSPDASGNVYDNPLTFADLFWRVFFAMGLRVPEGSTNCAFLFELTTPLNRIVVRQTEEKLTLLGIRRRDGKWIDPEDRGGYPVVKSYPLRSFEEIVASFASIDPLSQEGFVVVDAAGNRVKVKHPGYVALHHMKGEGVPSPKRALQVVLAGEVSEVLTAFPEFAPYIEDADRRFRELAGDLDAHYQRLKHIPIQKDFAAEALKTRCSGALFQLRQGRVGSAGEFLGSMPLDRLAELLGMRESAVREAA